MNKIWAPIWVWLFSFALLAVVSANDASARHLGTAVPVSGPSCPKSVDGNCAAGVAAGGIYYGVGGAGGTPGGTAFLAMVAQSGQTYTTDVNFNRCGVEYGCGPNKLDSAMTNIQTLTSGQIPGCGAWSNNALSCTFTATQCPSGTVTIDSLFVYDTTLNITLNTCKLVISNSTFMANLVKCPSGVGGQQLLNISTSSSPVPQVTLTNYKVQDGSDCSPFADVWGTPVASGAGLPQEGSFTGTFSAGTGAAPAIVTVSPSTTTGSLYSTAYLNWTGRVINACCSGPFSEFVQLQWNAQWIGNVTSSGGTITEVSTDASSPNPFPTGGEYLAWGNAINNLNSRQGVFINSCTSSHPFTCTTAGVSPGLTSSTPVVFGTKSCTGSACDNSIWTISALPTANGSPISMTAGPVNSQGSTMGIQETACNGYESRFGYLVREGSWNVSKSGCPIDVASDYFEQGAGEIGYFYNGSNRGGVPHLDGPVFQQAAIGSSSTIALFSEQYETVFTSKWNINGDITALMSFATNIGGQNYFTNWTQGLISNNFAADNESGNNGWDDGTQQVSNGDMLRILGQGFGSTNAVFSGTETNPGGGGGTLHVLSISSGTINVDDYMFSCTGCTSYWTGPQQITAQITTQGSDLSTWTTSYYQAISGTIDTGTYPSTIANMLFQGNYLDYTGSGASGAIAPDVNVPVTTHTCSGNVVMTGTQPNPYSC